MQASRRTRVSLVMLALASLLISPSWAEEVMGCSKGVSVRAVSLGTEAALLRNDGTVLARGYCEGGEYSDGVIRFNVCEGGVVYLREDGSIALSVKDVNRGEDFSEGLAAVYKGRYGYIDKAGTVVIGFQFDSAGQFRNGLAPVQTDGNWRYIDRNGRTAFVPKWDDYSVSVAYEFADGLAAVMLAPSGGKEDEYTFGYVDTFGHWAIPPRSGAGMEFHAGLTYNNLGEDLGFIAKTGTFVIRPQFKDVSWLWFEEDLAAVATCRNGEVQYGYIDSKGKWKIEPTWDVALHFCNGLAAVQRDGEWGFIDKAGNVVIPPQFRMADSFDAGIAEVLIGKGDTDLSHAFIDTRGKIIFTSSRAARIITFDEAQGDPCKRESSSPQKLN